MTQKSNWELLQEEMVRQFCDDFRDHWAKSEKDEDAADDIFGGLISEAEEVLQHFYDETLQLIDYELINVSADVK